MRQDEIDSGERPGLSTDERRELTELRRAERRVEPEDEILERAAAHFGRENVSPR
jgi:transposase